jgi:hypothetical protein
MPAGVENSVRVVNPEIWNCRLTIAIKGFIIQESELYFIFFDRRNEGGTI